MKYIEIRKSYIEYCPPPLEPTKAFACICVDLIWTIYQSGVLALGGTISGSPKTGTQLSKNGSNNRYLKYHNLLILCTSFASSNWKWDAVKPSFIICSSEKLATSHFTGTIFCNRSIQIQAYFFTAFDLLTCKNKL